MHIPLVHTTNSSALIEILEGRGNVLALTGHIASKQTEYLPYPFLPPTRNHKKPLLLIHVHKHPDHVKNSSPPDACGTPRNYFVFDFTEKDYSFRYKGIGMDASRQMNIWIAGIDSTDVYIDELRNKHQGEMLVTVYGASDSTIVRCRLDNGERISTIETSWIYF